jgi:hypothetical protein
MTDILSSRPFYTTFVTPLDASIPSKIQSNPKFWPYFKDVIGAVDGCHIPISPPAIEPLRIETAKVFFLKTVSSYAGLILTSSIHFVDGKDQHQTFRCMKKRLLVV